MKSEFKKVVKEVLANCSVDSNNEPINMSSEAAQNLVAEAIEKRVKSKFHIFKINELLQSPTEEESPRLCGDYQPHKK